MYVPSILLTVPQIAIDFLGVNSNLGDIICLSKSQELPDICCYLHGKSIIISGSGADFNPWGCDSSCDGSGAGDGGVHYNYVLHAIGFADGGFERDHKT